MYTNCILRTVRRIPTPSYIGSLAQLEEHETFNLQAPGSSPGRPTTLACFNANPCARGNRRLQTEDEAREVRALSKYKDPHSVQSKPLHFMQSITGCGIIVKSPTNRMETWKTNSTRSLSAILSPTGWSTLFSSLTNGNPKMSIRRCSESAVKMSSSVWTKK